MLSVVLTMTLSVVTLAWPAALPLEAAPTRPAAVSANPQAADRGTAPLRSRLVADATAPVDAAQQPPAPAQRPPPESSPAAPTPTRPARGVPAPAPKIPEIPAAAPKLPGEAQPAVVAPENLRTVIFRPKHASSRDLAAMASRMYPNTRQHADERTNALILVGPEEVIPKLLELLEQLDGPAEPTARTDFATVRIRNRSANEVGKQIITVMSSRLLGVAVDDRGSTILLSGSRGMLSTVRQLIAELDSPAASVSIEFAFFQAGAAEREGAPAPPPIPADLAAVAKELERFGRLRLLGRLSTIALEAQEFNVNGRVSGDIRANVRGRVASGSGDGPVMLNIVSTLTFETSITEAASQSPPSFELATVVSTKRGDYVVLGSAPAGLSAGESAILVLHVRP